MLKIENTSKQGLLNIGCVDAPAVEAIGKILIEILNSRTYWWVKIIAIRGFLRIGNPSPDTTFNETVSIGCTLKVDEVRTEKEKI